MRMKPTICLTGIVATLTFGVCHGSAQISITSGIGQTHSQNFDYDGVSILTNGLTRHLASTYPGTPPTGAEVWVNNVDTYTADTKGGLIGMVGWYTAAYTNSTDQSATYAPLIRANSGAAGGGFSSFATTSTTLDKAFGTAPFDSETGAAAGSFRIGARFANNTGLTISGFTFSYDGEQWRVGGTTSVNNDLAVSYATFGAGLGSLESVSYSGIALATFSSPVDSGTAGGLDGNAPANRVAGLGDTITGLTVLPGEEIWLRWFDANNSGPDHGLAIDNLTISFTTVPEPSMAALMGLGLTALIGIRRRSMV
jgi:hypothetical protein